MTHDGDILARHALPGTFRARKITSADLPGWLKEKIAATVEVRPTDFCLHLHSGPQTIVRLAECPLKALCLRCHERNLAKRTCVRCGTPMMADLSEWYLKDIGLSLPSGGPQMRVSAACCPACAMP
ncbi:hypothetical protein AB0L85_11910 [Streptomyces sp. NPDC052051]|uniref:hypothetical protein n=1 Tax=Streptomyces sp. NPDC052051 TaxID=3154649 RepID=UPI0034472169